MPNMSSNSLQNGKVQKKKKKSKQKPLLERAPQQQTSADGNSKFARALGSTDYATRDKGVQALSKFLLYKDELADLDMMKLWKGIFFCFWHSDKVPVQTELAERLANLLPQMKPRMAQLYWAGLLSTLRREWFAMDHHRIDKFLMLVRKFVAALHTRLAALQWDPAAITSLTLELPLDQTLIPTALNKSMGLSYHLADIWIQELRKVAAEQSVPHDSLVILLEPFVRALEASGEQPLLTRIKDSVFDALVSDILAAASAGVGAADSDSDEGREQYTYCQQLNVEVLVSRLFERGAAEGVKSRNRQVLYSISKDLQKAARKQAAIEAEAADEQQQQQPQQKKRKKQQQQEQQTHQAELQPQAGQSVLEAEAMPQDSVVRKKIKKRKKQDAQSGTKEGGVEQQQQEQQPMTNGTTPLRQKQAQQQQQQQQDAAGQTPVPAAAVGVAAVHHQQNTSAKKSGKKKKRSLMASEAQPSAMSAAEAPAAVQDGGNAGKRGVVIDLKKNVYFAHGAPVPPEEIRTPPTAKPKGSALKYSSKLAPATAPVQRHASRLDDVDRVRTKAKPVTPSSVPRVKAAAFF